jgi:hypothetical protein
MPICLLDVAGTTEYIGRKMLTTFFSVGPLCLPLHLHLVRSWYTIICISLPDVNEWKKYSPEHLCCCMAITLCNSTYCSPVPADYSIHVLTPYPAIQIC